jgi:lipopolysaccharide/colanic/teichoic acid biosynthesis glycosyltransferase
MTTDPESKAIVSDDVPRPTLPIPTETRGGTALRAAESAVHPNAGRGYWLVKRTMDAVLSGLALIVLALPLLVIALAIKLGDRSAPVFFRQPRTGKGGRRFDLLKFRTMVPNADELKEELREHSEVAWPDFRLQNDPRVTSFGRFLRKTSLDELPQFINVLRGDMSLVGPRPTSFEANTYDIWQTGRLDFRPGLTGPWQVQGRDSMDFEQRCRLEISFFREPSIWREVKLMFQTVGVVLKGTGSA